VASLASYDAQVIYRVQRVMNGVAIYAPADQIEAIRSLPGVRAIYPLIPKEPTNARTDNLLNAPAIWEGIERAGLTGEGVTIAVIDTGIDYLHTMFGGPVKGYLENDPNVLGDAANFPGLKIIGGYDFAGDSYDASPTSISYQPVPEPDPDPMDCYGFGHGTHVAGTAAGYGVRLNGSTYPGPYDSTIALSTLRIGPGLAPAAQLYALKVFGCTGSSNVVDAAIEWAVDPNQDGDFSDHVDVINLSLGSSYGGDIDATTIAAENAAQLGILVVASAGNTGDVHYAVGSPGMASGAMAVAATSVDSTDPSTFLDGTVAAFSARGPGRSDNRLKPDIAAPGSNVVSARRGTGTQSVTSSGTSMASPAVAGIMALLRQAYPADSSPLWRAHELKALAMNTARYPLLRPDINGPYSVVRVGAGRIDPTAALASALIAYDAAAPEAVSVNFGAIEVLDHTTTMRAFRLANKSAAPISVTVGYIPVSDLPGVTVDVGVSRTITVPAQGVATMPVTLTVDAAALARRADPARQLVPVNVHPWVDEASGYISFTPVITSSGPAIHVPLLALPRLVSAFEAASAPIVLGNSLTATHALTLTGSAITNVVAPTQSVPLVGVFGLTLNSPPVAKTPAGEPMQGRFAPGDLRYIGVAGPMVVDGERMLYFALVSYGDWSTPLEVTYQIAIDINEDDVADFRLQNREATDISTFDFATTDEFVSMLDRAGSGRTVQGPLNLFPATAYDTRPFMNNVMVLPLRLDEIGASVRSFRYQVKSTSRDLENSQTAEYIELTPVLALQLDAGAAVAVDRATPLFPATLGDELTLTFDRAAYIQQQMQGVLLLYLHNDTATRTQVLPVQFAWDEQLYLPGIGVE
jgi:subtilisin family serine protease